ncbi:protein AAR2 homolog [Lethenteron reissneri]|uniref:protein AAR2 homolog n=1 Tax=Lethenteron reissneri TaxID=7753 RepID=UPI002AB648D0|nr:protein AAR2 homolog [Lethenteron reissneri]
MDQDTAQRLYAEGAFLVFLGVPEGTEFGIDYNTWEVGPLFKGIKMIPPGMHFVHFSAVRGCGGKPGVKAEGSGPKSSGAGDPGPWGRETGPRTGFFHEFGKRELLVRKWDVAMEDAASEEVASDEVERIRASLKDLDRNLAPYPYDTLRRWVSLSGHVTGSVAARLLPLSGRVCAFAEMEPETPSSNSQQRLALNLPRNDTECSSLQEGEARLPIMKQRPGTEIRFSELPQHPFPAGASPADVTRHSLDRSLALDALLAKHYPQDEHGILGELQFAFVCFLLGGVYDAFEQWKRLLALLCGSEAAALSRPRLYRDLIPVLYHQLDEVPRDFFVDIVTRDNFLTSTLQVFFSILSGADVERSLHQRAAMFKQHLTRKFRWDFDAEPEDCAPVLVELPDGMVLG